MARKTILIIRTKYQDEVWDVSTPEKEAAACLAIVQQKLDNGDLFYPDDAESVALDILETKDGKRAWDFIQDRGDFEYEGYAVDFLREG